MAKKRAEEIVDDSNISSFLQEMNKAAGRTVAYIPAKSDGAFDVKRMSSGVLAIDIAIGGGYPLGRNIYFVGPKSTCKSTLMYLAMANITKKGNVYIEDAENTFDNNYAIKLGVDTSKMVISRSRTAEEVFNNYRCATDSGIFKAVFLDSIAALQPAKLVDGSNADNVMGGIGRITSVNMANLEKDKFACSESKGFMPTVFYTNQVRKKVGMVFGCLRGDNIIPTVDGKYYTIKDIVKNRLGVEVWSMNEKTKEIEPKRIIGWHYNGEVEYPEEYLEIEYVDEEGEFGEIYVTSDHKVFVNGEWVEANNIKKGDVLKSILNKYNNKIFFSLLMCSDTKIVKKPFCSPYIEIREVEGLGIMKWKILQILKGKEFDFRPSFSLFDTKYKSKRNPFFSNFTGNSGIITNFAENLSYEGLALWYSTDGGFYKDSLGTTITIGTYGRKYKREDIDYFLEKLIKFTGLNTWSFSKRKGFILSEKEGELFFKKIHKYVPLCEQRRLPVNYRINNTVVKEFKLAEQIHTVTEVRRGNKNLLGKYDITVEDNRNYVVGSKYSGVVVHNSPDTEPGGEAPDFYASVRLDLSPGEKIEEDGLVVGGKFTFRVTKNKTYPAWRTGEFYMRNDGIVPPYISNEWTLLDLSIRAGVIEKSGSWYKYLGSNIAQGAMNALKVIQEFPFDKKNELLGLAMGALYPNIKLEFRFTGEKDEISTDVK